MHGRTEGRTDGRTGGRTTFWDLGIAFKSISCFKTRLCTEVHNRSCVRLFGIILPFRFFFFVCTEHGALLAPSVCLRKEALFWPSCPEASLFMNFKSAWGKIFTVYYVVQVGITLGAIVYPVLLHAFFLSLDSLTSFSVS